MPLEASVRRPRKRDIAVKHFYAVNYSITQLENNTMILPSKKLVTAGLSLSILTVAVQFPKYKPEPMTANELHLNGLHLNGTHLNGFTLNSLHLNGQAIQPSSEAQSDWIRPASTEVILPNQAVEGILLEGGQLTFRLSE